MLDTIVDTDSTSFFKTLGYSLITVSVQPEAAGALLNQGQYFSPKNRIRAVTPDVFHSQAFQQELQVAQMNGFAIYFTINEGDGLPAPDAEPGNLNCGKRTNIQVLRTLAIDTDSADVTALMAKLKEIDLSPTITVRSSTGKYHLYFTIKPLPAVGENVLMWQALQKYLHALVPDLDQSMTDINQVLRIPGFLNLKPLAKGLPAEMVKLVSSGGIAPLDLPFIYNRLSAHTHVPVSALVHAQQITASLNGANGNHSAPNDKTYAPFTFPTASLSPGERRTTITRYIEHIMENILPLHAKDEDYFVLVDAFIIKYLSSQDAKDFLPGGHRRKNIEDYFRDQRSFRIRKHQAFESASAIKQHDHITAIETSTLPNSFYLNFPGDLGMLVREIHSYLPKMSLELAFAGALQVSGALKSESFRYKGAWPFVNGLVVAGTGAGKSQLKSVVQEILKAGGMSGPYSQLIDFQNTVQSLHERLYTAGGTGTAIVDEGGDYLQVINGKNAPGYAKALKKYFKESTTGRGKGTRLTPGGSMSYKVPAIDYGMLSLWIYIQPGMFQDSLNIKDMGDGFLPRFFVFNGETKIDLLSTYADDSTFDTFECSLDLQVWIDSLTARSPYSVSASLTDCLTQVEVDILATNKKAKRADILLAQRDAVYRLRSEARLAAGKVNVVLSDEAEAAVRVYLKEKQTDALKLQTGANEDPALGIYVRMEEMLNRLICCAAGLDKRGSVDLAMVEACIQFVRFQTDRFFRQELPELCKGEGEKELDAVMQGLKKAVSKAGGAVTQKEMTLQITSSRRPKNMAAAIKDLVARGEVWVQERPHKRASGRNTTVYLPAASEELID